MGSFAASVHNHPLFICFPGLDWIACGERFFAFAFLAVSRSYRNKNYSRSLFKYFLSSDKIHRIDATSPSTCTLVVQGPPEKAYSRVFDLANATFRDIYDLPSRFPELISLLGSSLNT